MARGTLAQQTVDIDGLVPTETNADAVNFHQFTNGAGVFLWVRNTDASTHNVTLVTPASFGSGVTVADPVIAVLASETKLIGPFDAGIFNNSGADAGLVFVNPDHSTLRLACLKVPS